MRLKRFKFKDHLHPDNQNDFFQKVIIGKSYTYSFDNYLFSCVKNLAQKNGVTIIYNAPRTPVYKELGDTNFTVIGVPKLVDIKPQIFDPKNLVNEVNEWHNIEI